jgi:hypothetical protein
MANEKITRVKRENTWAMSLQAGIFELEFEGDGDF